MHDQIVRRDDAFERAPSRGRIRVKDAVSAPLRSMLVDALPERLEILAATLAAAGHRIVACLSAGADLHSDVIKIDPAVVIIEIDAPDREILEDMHAIHRETPRPIIVFTQDQDPSLNYWLAAQGIDPLRAVHARTVPPPQMVSHWVGDRIDGYSAGEPWNALAVAMGIGFTMTTSQAIWPDHPEKVVASTREFARRYPNTTRALLMPCSMRRVTSMSKPIRTRLRACWRIRRVSTRPLRRFPNASRATILMALAKRGAIHIVGLSTPMAKSIFPIYKMRCGSCASSDAGECWNMHRIITRWQPR